MHLPLRLVTSTTTVSCTTTSTTTARAYTTPSATRRAPTTAYAKFNKEEQTITHTKKTLAIELTYDCQLRCPWCAERHHVGTKQGPISKQLFEKLMHHIIKEQYTAYVYQGGEPLLYSDELLEITDIIRNEIPSASFRTFTNGLALTENLVMQMNDRAIGATISVEAEGYKGLKNLIDKATEPTKILDNIKALKNKNIRTVTQLQQPFAGNLLLLHAVFPNIQIETVPDYTTITQTTHKDLIFMQNEFNQIKEKTNGDTSWLMPLQAFYGKCTAQADWFILDTGLIYEKCPIAAKAKSGCRKFASQMPSHLFELYRQISKELNPQCQ